MVLGNYSSESQVKIDVYTEFNNDLENIWVKFEKDAVMTPFQSYAWLSHWQYMVGKPLFSVQPQIVHLHMEGNTIAILPMGIRKIFGVRILEWLGLHQADYMGPLIIKNFDNKNYDENTWDLIESSLSKFDVIHLIKQFELTVKFLKNINCLLSQNQNLKAYKASLPDKWDDYFGNIKKRLRSDSLRQQRRLEEIGKVRFTYAKSHDEKNKIIKSMVIQKSKRYREMKVPDMLVINEYKKFYESLAGIFSNNLKVHCASLDVKGKLVATHVGIVDDDTFYYLMPANEGGDWKKYSPGRLLLLELLKWSIEKKLKFFDFTVGGEAYKKDWCNIEIDLFEVSSASSFLGRIYLYILILKETLKKVPFLIKVVKVFRK